jgi:hypothetical protein
LNLEEAVKKHLADLQRHIKANVLADVGGKVRRDPPGEFFFVHTAL